MEDGSITHVHEELILWKLPSYQKQSTNSVHLYENSGKIPQRQKKIIILKFTQKHKKLKTAKAVLSKDNTAGEMTLPDFNLHYRAIGTNGAWDQHKNRFIDQWTGVEGSEMPNTHRRRDSIFNKGCQDIGYQHGAWNSILISHPHKTQLPSSQGPQRKTWHNETARGKKEKALQYAGIVRLSEQIFLGIPCLQSDSHGSVYSHSTG